MTLYEQIMEDIKTAMKGRDAETLSILRLLSASLKNKTIELKKELEDAEVLAVVKSDVKKLQDALVDFTKAAREDLIEKSNKEIAILKKYLPPEMDAVELEKIVKSKLEELGVTDISEVGKAMGAIMADVKGAVDGFRVKETIEKILNGGE
ncbi:MAG: GatB/YqeY domain-containing protein [Candidatus Uhrbacteria bacterium]|nr:GatB/YqeY domain-containing protein [Candidatus Uhrbacteria bacterium]